MSVASTPGMRAMKGVLLSLLVLGAVAGVAALFVDTLGGGGAGIGEAAGVLFAPPPGYRTVEGGEIDRAAAATRLLAALDAAPGEARVGLHFTSRNFELYWLVDRSDASRPLLVELAAGPTGTRVATEYPGDPRARLVRAATDGRLDAPGLPAGTSRNLYH